MVKFPRDNKKKFREDSVLSNDRESKKEVNNMEMKEYREEKKLNKEDDKRSEKMEYIKTKGAKIRLL